MNACEMTVSSEQGTRRSRRATSGAQLGDASGSGASFQSDRRDERPRALAALAGLGLAIALGTSGCNSKATAGAGGPSVERRIADAMYAVLSSDRATYTREVVDRLQNKEKVLTAGEHFREEKLLPLPAQMLRMSAEEMRKKRHDYAVALLSPWPINRQNAAHTEIEKAAMDAITKDPDQPYTGEETLGKNRYFTAVYADRAVSDACVSCHNKHEESPRHDFKLNDVLGGIVIRVAI
ncbi:MAG TPA: DUF3365 domain-containing protein [Polyangia bacterium]